MKYIAPLTTQPDKRLSTYIKLLKQIKKYESPEGFKNIPFDESILESALALKKHIAGKNLKYIIDIGIGGANLGTKAVYDALFGYYDVIDLNRFPKIIFLDTIETSFLNKLISFIKTQVKHDDEVLINIVSKSGKTTEILFNMGVLLQTFPNLKKRVVVTTNKNSPLWNKFDLKLEVPEKIGDRYLVFSNEGLFPLVCANVNVLELLKGAMQASTDCLKNSDQNCAAVSATAIYETAKSINENFYFSPQLESLGKWHRQLMSESLGKNGTGITPTVAIGTTDLHSMAQLHLGGPKDKYFNFVSVENDNAVKQAILLGVLQSYAKHMLLVSQTILEDVSEKSLGYFMQFKMFETVFLAQLMGVNAFDQPDVEEYKANTRKLLQSK
ncbi:MAG TPA: hypothetical protein VLI92_02550 [Candidatus Saccharimonadales bacterium]|nr:hypothetical protein [Candidatus Saccharimonadales bacterium]